LQSIRDAGDDLEIIVVDDASTDDTAAVCANQPDILYVRQTRQSGTAHSRNVGLEMSTSEFVAFVDDDDLRLPGTISRQVERLRRAPEAALIHGRAFLGDSRYSLPNGAIVPDSCAEGDLFWSLLEANRIVTPTVVARKRFIEEVGMFDPDLGTMEDYDLWVRLAEHHPFIALDEVVAIYRSRSMSSGQKTSDRVSHGRARRELLRKMLGAKRARAATRRSRTALFRRHMKIAANSLVEDAAEAFTEGEVQVARQYLKEALRLRPLHVRAYLSLLSLFSRSLVEKAS
jgi:glycosyltransferase involved in cell wall biosynthesis